MWMKVGREVLFLARAGPPKPGQEESVSAAPGREASARTFMRQLLSLPPYCSMLPGGAFR